MTDFNEAWRSASPPGTKNGAPQEPLTPPAAEERITKLSAALEENERALVAAADAELDAQADLDNAEIKWRLAPECPQAGVVAGVRTTVDYVNAWVADKVTGERDALKVAKQQRKAAEAQRDRINRQLIAAQSLAKSVNATFGAVR